MTCQKVKFDMGKAPGLLQPLPILNAPWESIPMDFIFWLPKSIHGNTNIWTIVDLLVNRCILYLLKILLNCITSLHFLCCKFSSTMA